MKISNTKQYVIQPGLSLEYLCFLYFLPCTCTIRFEKIIQKNREQEEEGEEKRERKKERDREGKRRRRGEGEGRGKREAGFEFTILKAQIVTRLSSVIWQQLSSEKTTCKS